MLRWLLARCLWMLVTLVGITFVTLAMLDLAPVDGARLEAARREEGGSFASFSDREKAILQLRIHRGMVDATTLEREPLWRRYGNWLGDALTLRLAGPNEDDDAFWRRLGEAMPVSLMLGFLALSLTLVIAVPLGGYLGMRAGSVADRTISQLMFVIIGIPEFLLATLLLLGFSGAWLSWFPIAGLESRGAAEWSRLDRWLDLAWHLALPVAVMASGPTVLVTRFLRDSVARAAASPFAANLRALGIPPRIQRRRLLLNGAAPLATLAGSLLPMLVSGSLVVENMFSLDGLGHLAYSAAEDQDQAMVMALVLFGSTATLLALIASDVLQRIVDPRVRVAT
ncbi:MAG: ABC transporter permease [Planctomycetes bacterium]|nr:ABC transporter permease [Planctomycetota bacterium]